jgi:hypothetical protein
MYALMHFFKYSPCRKKVISDRSPLNQLILESVDGTKEMDIKATENKVEKVKYCFGSRRKEMFYATTDFFMKNLF